LDLHGAKSRPALVVQADDLKTGLPHVIVAMITSNMSRANHPSRVQVSLSTREGRQSGLLAESVVMTDNITTVFEGSFGNAQPIRAVGHGHVDVNIILMISWIWADPIGQIY
jgi:mRNA-degrading endonuclease toxin of MazEF toxin-antitoxin module